jgi:hypothetical protein
MLPDVPASLVFFVPITTSSTYIGTYKLVERDNSLPAGPAGRFRTTRCSVVLLSAQIAAEGAVSAMSTEPQRRNVINYVNALSSKGPTRRDGRVWSAMLSLPSLEAYEDAVSPHCSPFKWRRGYFR